MALSLASFMGFVEQFMTLFLIKDRGVGERYLGVFSEIIPDPLYDGIIGADVDQPYVEDFDRKIIDISV